MAGLLRSLRALGLTVVVSMAVLPATAQEYLPTEAAALKASPQRFWARGVVFQDTLKEAPGDRTLRIDDRTFTRFFTEELGEVYAAEEAVEPLRAATVGETYLFSGTVNQRGRQYLYIIRAIEPVKKDVATVVEQLEEINRGITTNPYNRVFVALESIMAEIQKDLFAYATAQKITVRELFDVNAGHMGKVQSSIHAALRRAEENSRTPSQEYLVSMIVAMMAMQNGYVEPKPDTFVPDETAPETPVVVEDAAPAVSEEDWDLIDQPLTADPAATETEPATEPVAETEPVGDEAPAPDADAAADVAADIETDAVAEPVEETPAVEETPVEPVVEDAAASAVEKAADAVAPASEPEPVAEDVPAEVPAEAGEVEVISPDDPFWNDPPAPETGEGMETPAEPVGTEDAAAPEAAEIAPEPAVAVEEPIVEEPVIEQPVAEAPAEPVVPAAPVATEDGETLPLDDPFWSDPALVDPSTVSATPAAPAPEPVEPEPIPDFMKPVPLDDPPILPEAALLEADPAAPAVEPVPAVEAAPVFPAEPDLSEPVPAGEKPKKPRKKKAKKAAAEDAAPVPAIEPVPAEAPQDAVDATPTAP